MTRSNAPSAAEDSPAAARRWYSGCAPISTRLKWSAVAASVAPAVMSASGAYQISMRRHSYGDVAAGGEWRRECSRRVWMAA